MRIDRPIVFFDLETTGISLTADRIVQIGAIKIYPDGQKEIKNRLIHPGIPIPKHATAIHGITDEDVTNEPRFRQIAKALYEWLQNCDLAGFNSDNFDIPILAEEFARVGIEYPNTDTLFLDILRIERWVNSHTLANTYRRYTGKKLENAHDALADIEATVTIFEKQLEQHDILQRPVSEIPALYSRDQRKKDAAKKLYYHKNQAYWNFGKNRHKSIAETIEYAKWVLESDFPISTKIHIRRILDGLEE